MSLLHNPEELSSRLQQAVRMEVQENLAMGIPVYYLCSDHPGKTIKQMPNGDRFYVQMDAHHNEIISGLVH